MSRPYTFTQSSWKKAISSTYPARFPQLPSQTTKNSHCLLDQNHHLCWDPSARTFPIIGVPDNPSKKTCRTTHHCTNHRWSGCCSSRSYHTRSYWEKPLQTTTHQTRPFRTIPRQMQPSWMAPHWTKSRQIAIRRTKLLWTITSRHAL